MNAWSKLIYPLFVDTDCDVDIWLFTGYARLAVTKSLREFGQTEDLQAGMPFWDHVEVEDD